jgi:carbamoyltransferase
VRVRHDYAVIALGLNGFAGADHDASAALVIDGKVVAAVEEERLSHRRHSPGDQPLLAIREVLRSVGADIRDIDIVCHGWRPEALGIGLREESEADTIRQAMRAADIPLPEKTPVIFADHHLAHFWSGVAFVPQGASRAQIDGLVIDGAGESTSGALFRLRNGQLEKLWNLGITGSLGLLYEAATAAIGFRPGDEGKTMGLASYGRCETMDKIPEPPDDRFTGPIPALRDRDEIRRHHRSWLVQMRSLAPKGTSFNARADLALGVQSAVESRIMGYLGEIPDLSPVLVMAGGVALNCSINATVAEWCGRHGGTLTVPPPANDAGIAIGAAISVSPDPASCIADGAFLGRAYAPEEIVGRLAAAGATVRAVSPGEIADGLLERDLLCGWFEGRAEIGPRALGKRAILARADSARVRDRLNVTKGRENWRPLAPSVLAEEFAVSFCGVPSPYMLVNCSAKVSAMGPLAGVIHVDNTARPQVLDGESAAGPFGTLLKEVQKRTGHAVLTCTSFNPAGQPLVYTPEDAHGAAVSMGLDLLAGDGWCVTLHDH